MMASGTAVKTLALLVFTTGSFFRIASAQGLRGGQELLRIRPLVKEPDWSLVGGKSQGLEKFHELLGKTFVALPKNERGRLGHSGVRYMLNRFFVKSLEWNVEGLETEAHWNGSSPIAILEGHIPPSTKTRLERQLRRHGMSVNETAVLAVLFQTVIQNMMVHDLRLVYLLHGLSLTEAVNAEDIDPVLHSYMAAVTFDKNVSDMEKEDIKWLHVEASNYVNWEHIKILCRDMRRVAETTLRVSGKFTFADTARLLPQITKHLRREKDTACEELKNELISMEDRNHGCVHLSKFYDAFVTNGTGTYTENPEYLKRNGLLEDSDPRDASVITRNYIALRSNCKRASPLHNMCCESDRCDNVFEKIEQEVAAPDASPSQILSVVSGMAKVSDAMKGRLNDIAQQGGRVRLHGRLFAQWMHHVFPRDCQYPEPSDVPHVRWTEKSLITFKEAEEYVNEHLSKLQSAPVVQTEATCMPWSTEEEPYVVSRDKQLSSPHFEDYIFGASEFLLASYIQAFLVGIALISGLLVMLRHFLAIFNAFPDRVAAAQKRNHFSSFIVQDIGDKRIL